MDFIEKNKEFLLARMDLSYMVKLKNVLNELFGSERNQISDPFTSSRFLSYKDYDISEATGSDLNQIMQSIPIEIIIHFPEIDIKNSVEKTRKIYDLYVKLYLGLNFKLSGHLAGTVTTYEKDAFTVGYMHSHLGVDVGRFRDFCLGTGTPLSMLSAKWSANPFSEAEMKLFFLQVKEYVKWESLEGGPHILMEDIPRRVNNVNHNGLYSFWNFNDWKNRMNGISTSDIIFFTDIIESLIKEQLKIDSQFANDFVEKMFSMSISGSMVKLHATEHLNDTIFKLIISFYDTYIHKYNTIQTESYSYLKSMSAGFKVYSGRLLEPKNLIHNLNSKNIIVTKYDNNRVMASMAIHKKYVDENVSLTTNNQLAKSPFYSKLNTTVLNFKNQPVKVKLKEEIQENKTEIPEEKDILKIKHIIHPSIIENVTNKYSKLLQQEFITACTATRLKDSSESDGEATTADILTMLGD